MLLSMEINSLALFFNLTMHCIKLKIQLMDACSLQSVVQISDERVNPQASKKKIFVKNDYSIL